MAARKTKTLIEKFRVREEDQGYKAKAIRLLTDNLGRQLPIARIQDAIYGKGKGNIKATKQVLNNIQSKSLGGTGTILKREGRGDESTHGLYARRA